jgi:hypothetical protein
VATEHLHKNVFGRSPLGANSVEGTSPADAPVKGEGVRGVPLVYSPLHGFYVAEQRLIEEYDREEGLIAAEYHIEEEEFLRRAGFRHTVE